MLFISWENYILGAVVNQRKPALSGTTTRDADNADMANKYKRHTEKKKYTNKFGNKPRYF
jgi:hypothetical protein